MKILVICSKTFYDRIEPIKQKLEEMGHSIELPNSYDNPGAEKEAWELGDKAHSEFKKRMFQRSEATISNMDAVLTLNFDKNGQQNYIGGATFLELYEAFMKGKKIYMYNPIPEGMLYDEISGFSPIIINGNLNLVKQAEGVTNMEELIDVLNEDGTKTGEIVTRKEVHEKGLWHKIAVIAIIDKKGHILMQQRAKDTENNPEKWDVSVAGHVSTGQTSIEAAIREVKEEIGMDLEEKDLQYMLTYQTSRKLKDHFYSNHIFDFYMVKTEVIDVSKIKIQESEVEQVKLCNLEEVQYMLSKNLVLERKPVYELLIKYLK